MQKKIHVGLADRMLFYNSKSFVDSVKKGEVYDGFSKTITILFVDDNFFNDNVSGYHDIFCMKSTNHDRIFSMKQEIHVIELNKVPRGVNAWFDFVIARNLEEMKMAAEKNPIINDAIDVVKFFSADEMARHNALREQVAMIDEVHRMKDSRPAGVVEGIEKGIEKGIEEVAWNMLKRGMEISLIIEITGLSEKQVVDISKSMNV